MEVLFIITILCIGLKFFGVVSWAWWIVVFGPTLVVAALYVAAMIIGGIIAVIFVGGHWLIVDKQIFKRTKGVGRRH